MAEADLNFYKMLTNMDMLQRFLYTGVTHNYFSGKEIQQLDRWPSSFDQTCMLGWTQDPNFEKTLETADQSVHLQNRETIFTVFARVLSCKEIDEARRIELRTLLLRFLRSDKDFLQFVKVYSKMYPLPEKRAARRKFPTTLKKIARKWYDGKTAVVLATMVAKRLSYSGWTHKRVMKLCHIKVADPEKERVIKYVLFGLVPSVHGDENNEVNRILNNHHLMRKSTDAPVTIDLIPRLQGNGRQISTKLNKTEEVVVRLFHQMSPRKILKKLRFCYEKGFLYAPAFLVKMREILTTIENVRQARLNPVEVFVYLKLFETGGKNLCRRKATGEIYVIKPKPPANVNNLTMMRTNIGRCLSESYNNIRKGRLRILITVDLSNVRETHCHQTKIESIEAMASIIRYFHNIEDFVRVAMFNGTGITEILLERRAYDVADKLRERSSPFIFPTAPMDWARKYNKHIDVFINMMSGRWATLIPQQYKDRKHSVKHALYKYNKERNRTARAVRLFLGAGVHNGELGKNCLTIAGFRPEVPKVLHAFCSGLFC